MFYMLLLEQDIARKEEINDLANNLPKPRTKFEAEDNKAYEVKSIINSTIYGQEINGQIPGLHYPVL